MMRNPTEKEITDFLKAARTLDKLGKSGFYIYMQDDLLHLMTCDSHDMNGNANYGGICATKHITNAGGGAW